MTQPFLGQIIQGGWNFAPRGYHMCDGSLMAISQNAALFALLGTSFGGNGTSTFGLPDLRGRTMVGWGQGPGLANYVLGEMTGVENVTLLQSNMPLHTHTATFTPTGSALNAATNKASAQVPAAGSYLGKSIDGSTAGTAVPQIYFPTGGTAPTLVALGGLNVAGTVTVGTAGGNLPFSILNPLTAVTVIIAVNGVFPSRN
jgi:microcystin-dependent protein